MRGNFKKGGIFIIKIGWKGKKSTKTKDVDVNFFLIDGEKIGL